MIQPPTYQTYPGQRGVQPFGNGWHNDGTLPYGLTIQAKLGEVEPNGMIDGPGIEQGITIRGVPARTTVYQWKQFLTLVCCRGQAAIAMYWSFLLTIIQGGEGAISVSHWSPVAVPMNSDLAEIGAAGPLEEVRRKCK